MRPATGPRAVMRGSLPDTRADGNSWKRRSPQGAPTPPPKPHANWGCCSGTRGDTARAKAAFQQAIASGHSHAARWAQSTWELCCPAGGYRRAEVAYQQALDSGLAHVGPKIADTVRARLKRAVIVRKSLACCHASQPRPSPQAIGGPLTLVSQRLRRSLAVHRMYRSGRSEASIGRIAKLIVRVRFPSPAPHKTPGQQTARYRAHGRDRQEVATAARLQPGSAGNRDHSHRHT